MSLIFVPSRVTFHFIGFLHSDSVDRNVISRSVREKESDVMSRFCQIIRHLNVTFALLLHFTLHCTITILIASLKLKKFRLLPEISFSGKITFYLIFLLLYICVTSFDSASRVYRFENGNDVT